MKRILYTLVFSLFSIALSAQSHLSLWVGGGVSSVSSIEGLSSTPFTYLLDLRYSYSFTPSFSLRTGVEYAGKQYSFHRDALTVHVSQQMSPVTPTLDGNFTYTGVFTNVSETGQLGDLLIPIMARYTFLGRRADFYVEAGAKAVVPLIQTYRIQADKIVTSGYFPYENVLYENIPNHGFGSYTSVKAQRKHTLQADVALAIELGTLIPLSRRVDMGIALFGDFGLLSRGQMPPVIEYDLTQPRLNSLLERANYFAAGVKITITGGR